MKVSIGNVSARTFLESWGEYSWVDIDDNGKTLLRRSPEEFVLLIETLYPMSQTIKRTLKGVAK